MKQVVIENPVITSPFDEPNRHFKFSDEGITDQIVEGRRTSSYFVPIAQPKKKGSKQLSFETEWTQDRIEENKLVNDIRRRVVMWRKGGFVGVTPTTARLIAYWTDPDREKKLFFCQNEALQTAIYITEVASKYGDAWIENDLRAANDTSNPGLPRMAFKMATGAGKTVVMAMLIAWHTLNKRANPQDARFSDTFLVVTPGITIRDRLRVLLPNDPDNYYRQRDVLPAQLLDELGQAKILITNFHALQLREKVAAGKITKSILADGKANPFTETPDQMVRRVCRELGTKKNIIVLNDEAHHCYRRRPDGEEEPLTGDERAEAKKRDEEARVWISGIEAVKAKIGIRAVYDLSATPFFLRGSGWGEGKLFPWVVSDFSLIDAIEAGIVKVPRVPVADDIMIGRYGASVGKILTGKAGAYNVALMKALPDPTVLDRAGDHLLDGRHDRAAGLQSGVDASPLSLRRLSGRMDTTRHRRVSVFAMRKTILLIASTLLLPAISAAQSSIPSLLLPEIAIAHTTKANPQPRALWEGDRPVVLWSDDADARGTVPGQAPFTIASNAHLAAAVAGPTSVLYAFVTSAGFFATASRSSPVLITKDNPNFVRAVWTGGNFVVVWSNGWNLIGCRVSADGRLIDGPNVFATAPALQWVQIASASGNVLVIWQGQGRYFFPSGALLTPNGVQSACAPYITDPFSGALVVSDGMNFLMTWTRTVYGPNPQQADDYIAASQVDSSGKCASAESRILSGGGGWWLFWTGSEYLLVWVTPPTTGTILFAKRVSSTAVPAEESITRIGTIDGIVQSIDRSSSGQLLVTYTRSDSSGAQILARYVTFQRLRSARHP